ncbi:MAG: glycoside hydrolase family 2 TIM barrel-domain containing protein, partial [Bacteroides sp.]
MKLKDFILFTLCLTALCGFPNSLFAQQDESPRISLNFNREWKYARGDFKGAEAMNFDDLAWETVGLPHSFSIPYFMSKDFYIGYGWYRKSLKLNAKELSKKMFLEFDGVFQEAEIFVNNQLVGRHEGGYTGFSVDISSAVKRGNNLIAVRVNNEWKSNRAPRAGEHVFSGGIYRNVRLVMKAPTFIDWYGTFVTTPDLEKNNGQSSVVNVQTTICNHSNKKSDYRLRTEVIDADGKMVTSIETTETIEAGNTKEFEQITPSVRKPRLWSPQLPVLYNVVSSLYQGKKLIDRYETSMGFRWFKWTVDNGFFFNGEHLYLKGANVHQDHAGWGDAVTETAMQRDVRLMKDAGFDFIRGSHYPHSPAFSNACDEEGMLFWSEAPFWGIGGFSPDGYWNSSAYPVNEKDIKGFEESVLQQLSEMIRIHRNHPSIVAWSMSNEPFFSAPKTEEGIRQLLKQMVDRSHELDSTRPAAVGGVQRPLGKDRLDLIGDVAGYNGDGSSIPDFQHPNVPNIVSEYGSTTADRPGEYKPGWGNLEEDEAWKGMPWRSGQAIWCGFDHGSIAGSQLGKMGIVDYFRIPKPAW